MNPGQYAPGRKGIVMDFVLKLLLSNAVIILSVQLGKRIPSLAGLIATMPLAGLIVLIWLYTEKKGDFNFMMLYTQGALWGIIPSIAFYLTALFCFSRHLSLPIVLSASFAVWFVGAVIHQRLLH
jgi:uncharacterized membrane protein (GlpM family)